MPENLSKTHFAIIIISELRQVFCGEVPGRSLPEVVDSIHTNISGTSGQSLQKIRFGNCLHLKKIIC